MSYRLRTQALSPGLGVEIQDVDVRALGEEEYKELYNLWLEHSVLLVRGQDLTDADLIAFSRHFGTLDRRPPTADATQEDDTPLEVLTVSNVVRNGKPIGVLGNGEAMWHSDQSHLESPPTASVLYSLVIPDQGGDTSFLNMYDALSSLDVETRSLIDGRRIKHDAAHDSAGNLRNGIKLTSDDPRHLPGTYHDIVVQHPETGKEALFLGRRPYAYVEGLDLAKSEALLDDLWGQATNFDRFGWRHRWKVGDILVWDNRCTMHRRDEFPADQPRIMHRTQVIKSPPERNVG